MAACGMRGCWAGIRGFRGSEPAGEVKELLELLADTDQSDMVGGVRRYRLEIRGLKVPKMGHDVLMVDGYFNGSVRIIDCPPNV